MVIDSEATGVLSPLDLARCQVGTAGGRAVGGGSRVADLVPFETLCSSAELQDPFAHPPLVLLQQHAAEFSQRIVERPDDALAVFDGKGRRPRPLGRGTSRARSVAARHESYELANVLVTGPRGRRGTSKSSPELPGQQRVTSHAPDVRPRYRTIFNRSAYNRRSRTNSNRLRSGQR